MKVDLSTKCTTHVLFPSNAWPVHIYEITSSRSDAKIPQYGVQPKKFQVQVQNVSESTIHIVYIILDEWLSYEDDLNISYLLRNPQLIHMMYAQDFDLVQKDEQARPWLNAMRWYQIQIQIHKVCTIKILILWIELNVKHGRGSVQCNESRRCL